MKDSRQADTRASHQGLSEQPSQPFRRSDSGGALESHGPTHAALGLLLQAFEYAHELGCSTWDFAVEIGELRKVGATSSSFRWLVCMDYVEHARETKPHDGGARTFRRRGRLTFTDKTCFVLTEAGVAFARGQKLGRALRPGKPAHGQQTPCPTDPPNRLVPKWDPDRQELRIGEVVVKRFKVPAANQERILAVFEEEGWPAHVDDPLSPHPDLDPKRRLHATINALNRNQRNHLIRFRGDGRGEGLCWELIEPGGNGSESGDLDD